MKWLIPYLTLGLLKVCRQCGRLVTAFNTVSFPDGYCVKCGAADFDRWIRDIRGRDKK